MDGVRKKKAIMLFIALTRHRCYNIKLIITNEKYIMINSRLYTRKTILKTVSIVLIFCFALSSSGIAQIEKGNNVNLAVDSAFSALASIKRLDDGRFQITEPQDPRRLRPGQYNQEKARNFAFVFLAFVIRETMKKDFSEEMLRGYISTMVYEEPMKSTIEEHFFIYNLYIKDGAIIIPLKKRFGRAIRFTLSSAGSDEEITEGLFFDIVKMEHRVEEMSTDASFEVKDLEGILYSTTEEDREYPEYEEKSKELYETYDNLTKELLDYLKERGGKETYFKEKVSVELDGPVWEGNRWEHINEDFPENHRRDRGYVPLVDFSGVKLPSGTIGDKFLAAFPEKLFPDTDNVNSINGVEKGNNRDVYLNQIFAIKTIHRPRSVSSDIELKVMLDEFRLQQLKGGGLPYSRPFAILWDGERYWLVEERGYQAEDELEQAIKYGQYDRASKIVRMEGMLLRFFYDIGRIPEQYDVHFSLGRDRIFVIDAGPHQYGGGLDKKESVKEYLISTIKWRLKSLDQDEKSHAQLKGKIENWFEDGFNNPEQFDQYKMMHQKTREGEKREVGIYVFNLQKIVSKHWNKFLTEKAWGARIDFVKKFVRPIGESMLSLRRLVSSYYAGTHGSKSLILYVGALDSTVFIDFTSSLKKIKSVFGNKGHIILYAEDEKDEDKAKKLEAFIKTALPDVKIVLVKKKDISKYRGGGLGSADEEVDSLIRYLTAKDADRDGMADIQEKDILGILRSNDGMDWVEFFKKYDHEVPCVVLNNNVRGVFSLTKVLELMLMIQREKEYKKDSPFRWIRILSPMRLTEEMHKEYLIYKEHVLNKA